MTGPGSFLYNVLFVLHIGAIVTAFGPTLAYAAMGRAAREQGGAAGSALAGVSTRLQRALSLPALVIAAVLGVLLVVISDGRWDFAQTWISASFTIVILLVVLAWFVLAPALKKQQELLAGPEDADALRSAKAMVAMSTGFLHLGLVALIALMVWKPGA